MLFRSVVDEAGNVFIADSGHKVVRVVMNQDRFCVATPPNPTPAPYPAAANFSQSTDVSHPVIGPFYNLTNVFEQCIYTVAGNGKDNNDQTYSFKNTMSAQQAQFSNPTALALDSLENLYISDNDPNGNIIYKVEKTTGKITLFAGPTHRDTTFTGGAQKGGVIVTSEYTNYNLNVLSKDKCKFSGIIDMTFDASDNLFILQSSLSQVDNLELQGYNVLCIPAISINRYSLNMLANNVYIVAGIGASGSYNPVNNYDCKKALQTY